MYRPCWVDIDMAAYRHNLGEIKRKISSKTQLLAVVKANGYGHGLIPMARAAAHAGAVYLGVSSLEEGVALRQAGIKTPVLILGTLYPFDNFPVLFDYRLTPMVASPEAADALDQLARKRRRNLPVHLKVDSGFGRIGVSTRNALRLIERIAICKGLELEGLCTHFSSSDVDRSYTLAQAQAFSGIVRTAAKRDIRPTYVHMANSSAVLRFPQTHGNLVRPGLALYGAHPYNGADRLIDLEPVLTWKTRVIFLKMIPKGFSVSYARSWTAARPTRVATLAVGYADGYPRHLSNEGEVLLKGKRARVIGRVTMDMLMVDVTQIPGCHVGDEAVLIGVQGTERIRAEELARRAKTNVYEILARIGSRVPRFYNDGKN